MTASELDLITERHPEHPELDMELSGRLLRAVAAGERSDVIRVFRPGPTVAFGRRDALKSGFPAASQLALDRGYLPVVRHAGGHAVVYDAGSVVVEIIRPETTVVGGLEPRFVEMSELVADALGQLDVDTERGELPDEYCPGRHSLHLHEGAKIAGVAQRIIKGASLTTAVIAVVNRAGTPALTFEIYAALGLPLDPSTVGAVADRYPEVTPDAVTAAISTLTAAASR